MSSLVKTKEGSYYVQFTKPDGERPRLWLGKCSKRNGELVKGNVESLINSAKFGTPLTAGVTEWLGECNEAFREKLAAVGLITYEPASPLEQLGNFLDHFIEARVGVVKNSTNTHAKNVAREMKEYFGNDKPLAEITRQDCVAYQKMLAGKHRPATVSRRLNAARMFFKSAKLDHLIQENHFESVRTSSGDVSERLAYVPADVIRNVIEYAPSPQWKLLIALARFAGLRMVSEPLSLKWSGIDWDKNRMTIFAPKTEGIAGKAYRTMPIFSELRPYLEAVWDMTEEGSDDYIFPLEWRQRAYGENGWGNANFRTHFERIILKAGVQKWTRLFHSLRASCITDLARQKPIHVVTQWVGNSPATAQRHYLTTIEADFTQAIDTDFFESGKAQEKPIGDSSVQICVQPLHEKGSFGKNDTKAKSAKCLENKGFASDCIPLQPTRLGDTGLEPVTPSLSS